MEIRDLLRSGVGRGASDIHLSAGLPPMIRVDGDLHSLSAAALESCQVRAWIDEVATATDCHGDDGRREADSCIDLPSIGRFRLNVFQQHRGLGAVFRVVPTVVPSLEDLELGAVFREIADAARGLVLVAGPTGSGKSTTLAAMIDYVNATRRQHILTIEDPIEFVHESHKCVVNQRQVGRDTHGLADALRAALREDPDVILIGELRDLETIRLALTAAETGHLVFATLHTPSAAKSIDRIVDVFAAGEKQTIRSILSESLEAVVWQTLVPRLGGGRVAAHEILIATTAVRNLVREQKIAQLYSVMQTSGSSGMQTLDQCLQRLVVEGVVSPESARARARFPDSVR